jgi:hypothetical protein
MTITSDVAPDVAEPRALHAAAQALDLSRARQLVYVGGRGEPLAAFLAAWPRLSGVWFGPAGAQGNARRFVAAHGLGERVHCVAGDRLDTIAAGDLVVLSALDEAVDTSLQLLASAGPRWLPVDGRWLMLQRCSPHLSSVVDAPLLQGLGLEVVSRWPLLGGVHMLVCTPARRFLELLASRSNRAAAWRPS